VEDGDDVDYDVKVGVIEDTLHLLNFGYTVELLAPPMKLEEVMFLILFVRLFVCLSVCLSVSRITAKVNGQFPCNLMLQLDLLMGRIVKFWW